jgi:hypothetical protein
LVPPRAYFEAGRDGKRILGPHADAKHDKIRGQLLAALEPNP